MQNANSLASIDKLQSQAPAEPKATSMSGSVSPSAADCCTSQIGVLSRRPVAALPFQVVGNGASFPPLSVRNSPAFQKALDDLELLVRRRRIALKFDALRLQHSGAAVADRACEGGAAVLRKAHPVGNTGSTSTVGVTQ